MATKLPQGVHIKDGQILMTHEANKKFRETFGDFIPSMKDDQLYVKCGRRTVFIDENMKPKKLGCVCVMLEKCIRHSRTNAVKGEDTGGDPNANFKVKDQMSAVAYSMLKSNTNFEFTEITNGRYTRYFPYQFNKQHVFVIVMHENKVVYENIVEEEANMPNMNVMYKIPGGPTRVHPIELGEWLEYTKYAYDGKLYEIGIFRF